MRSFVSSAFLGGNFVCLGERIYCVLKQFTMHFFSSSLLVKERKWLNLVSEHNHYFLFLFYRSQAFFFNLVRKLRVRDFFGGDGDDMYE